MALQGGQPGHFKGARTGTSPRVVSDSTTQTLSHSGNGDLADAFFSALGEAKPARKRRERASKIITDLTAEGFDESTIREACRLAGERKARGPDLLPHLVGEAFGIVEARAAEDARARQARERAQAAAEVERATVEQRLAVLDGLPLPEQNDVVLRARMTLPEGASEAVVRGLAAALAARGGAP